MLQISSRGQSCDDQGLSGPLTGFHRLPPDSRSWTMLNSLAIILDRTEPGTTFPQQLWLNNSSDTRSLITPRGDFCYKKYYCNGTTEASPQQASLDTAHLPVSQDPATTRTSVVFPPATCLPPTSIHSFRSKGTQTKLEGQQGINSKTKPNSFQIIWGSENKGLVFLDCIQAAQGAFSCIPMAVVKWTHLPRLIPFRW